MVKRKTASKLVGVLFLLAFLGFGLGGLYIIGSGTFYGLQSERWPTVQGKVEHAGVETRFRRKGRRRHKLILRYRYKVGMDTLVNDKARFLDNVFTSKSQKEDIVGRFPTGAHVPVYYNPANPSQAVLIPGVSIFSALAGAVVCLVFCAIGGGGIYKIVKPKHGDQRL